LARDPDPSPQLDPGTGRECLGTATRLRSSLARKVEVRIGGGRREPPLGRELGRELEEEEGVEHWDLGGVLNRVLVVV